MLAAKKTIVIIVKKIALGQSLAAIAQQIGIAHRNIKNKTPIIFRGVLLPGAPNPVHLINKLIKQREQI